MPSFIAASNAVISKVDPQILSAASNANFTISHYDASGSMPPSLIEFTRLKEDLKTFCEQIRAANPSIEPMKTITCEMLLFTGFHGSYDPQGTLNNLTSSQLVELVDVAKLNQINFKHIIADCCCAPFGLEKLQDLLASGGDAIGDSMNSQVYVAYNLLIEKIESLSQGTILDDE
jgi:hypothetical protein